MKQISRVEIVRMKAVADLLDDVQENHFLLDRWVNTMPRPRRTRLFGALVVDEGCGFAGCAMGWAAFKGVIPGFEIRNQRVSYPIWIDDKKVHITGVDAVVLALGISMNTAKFLFFPDSYKVKASTGMVADRVRRFVAKIEAIRARDRRRATKEAPKLELVA